MSQHSLENPRVHPVVLTEAQSVRADAAWDQYQSGVFHTLEDLRNGSPAEGPLVYTLSELEKDLGLAASVSFGISRVLRSRVEGKEQVEITAKPPTIGAALLALSAHYPELSEAIIDEEGVVRRHVSIYWEDDDIRFLPADTKISTGDKFQIIPAIAGGA